MLRRIEVAEVAVRGLGFGFGVCLVRRTGWHGGASRSTGSLVLPETNVDDV